MAATLAREVKTDTMTFRVSPRLNALAEQAAQRDGRTKSSWIEQLIKKAVEA
jgi:predicted HicB family RNase H-like nuclease